MCGLMMALKFGAGVDDNDHFLTEGVSYLSIYTYPCKEFTLQIDVFRVLLIIKLYQDPT